jgi:hypothetical protein
METKAKLGAKAMGRGALENNEGYELRESQSPHNLLLILNSGNDTVQLTIHLF